MNAKELGRAVALNIAALVITGWLIRQWPALRRITDPWGQ